MEIRNKSEFKDAFDMQGYYVYFKNDNLLFCNIPEDINYKELQDAINKLDDNHVIVIDL